MTGGRVLVTGAGGFVGAPAMAALRARGLVPIGLGRRTGGSDGAADWIACDLACPEATRAAVREAGAGRLVHLAWTVAPGRFWTDPDNLDWVGRSLTLLRAFAEAGGRRAVMVGTCAEYAWGQDAPLDERTTPLAPATLYGAAKDALRRAAEAYAAEARAGHGSLSVAWARLFFLYGPGEAPGRLVGDAVRRLLAGRPFDATEGRQRRDFLHVADAADALAALTASPIEGPVNIGAGVATPVRDLLAAIARHAGGADLLRLGARPAPPGDPACIVAGVRRLAGELGWAPRLSPDDGIAQMVAAERAAIAAQSAI